MERVATGLRIALLAPILVMACGAPNTPEDVAKAFWEALQAGDHEKAATFVTDESLGLLGDGFPPDEMHKVLLGDVLRNDTAALVRTSMITRESDVDLNVVFHTHLVLQQDVWKVDLASTRQELARATFETGMRFVGKALGQSVEELGKALEQGAADVRDAVREALEEMGKPDDESL